MTENKKRTEPRKRFNLRVPEEFLERIDEERKRRGGFMSRTAIILDALNKYLQDA